MAQYPDYAQDIEYCQDDSNAANYRFQPEQLFNDDESQDIVPVYKLYHARTRACPEGREVTFIGSGKVLDYGDLEYTEVPVYRMAAYNQHGTSFGYTVAFDLLAVQQAIDRMYSIILSNQSTFGVQNIWMKPGSKVTPNQLAGGLNLFESQEKPEAINLTNTPAEIFNFMKMLEELSHGRRAHEHGRAAATGPAHQAPRAVYPGSLHRSPRSHLGRRARGNVADPARERRAARRQGSANDRN
jgi:hypothetical protein